MEKKIDEISQGFKGEKAQSNTIQSKKEEKIPFADLKERLKESLKGQKFKETLDKKADDLFNNAKVEYKMATTLKADTKTQPEKK